MPLVFIHKAAQYFLLISVLLVTIASTIHAQLSPGDLSRAHAHLEGIRNCTKCHVLGDKVSNDKCLECHKEIKTRIDQKKGYHASSEVAGKDCFSCHSDHHGRNFEIIRFDARRFDHQKTGYALTGAHKVLDCKACHKPEKIESVELRKKENTYLGLRTDCIACHTDVHRNTLSTTNCATCHNTEAFAPAALFDHRKTEFPLKGKHRDVDCKRCHEVSFSNSALFQRFAGIPFNSCVDCHTDVHNNRFGPNCKQCHTEESFKMVVGKSSFNHNQTGFPLTGKHRNVDCASCHQTGPQVAADRIFQDYRGKDFHNCSTCHQDVHGSKFGTDCRQCHTEESFQRLLNPGLFEHDLTGYALEGKHRTVDCRTCHTTKMMDPLPHNRCADCHTDFHRGQFIRDAYQPDCGDCHSVEGFSGSRYTIEQHNEGSFPLVGAHLATPCLACHYQEQTWSFRDIGSACIDCHTDIHEGVLSEKYYPQKACHQCHSPDGWASISFDHIQTGFELQGRHYTTACTTCHIPETEASIIKTIPFSGLTTDCVSCHDNPHQMQFEKEGVTDCRRCHAFAAWTETHFDHNTARFVLTGAHLRVDCRECHKEKLVDNMPVIQYRMERFECVDCHQ